MLTTLFLEMYVSQNRIDLEVKVFWNCGNMKGFVFYSW